MILLPKYVRKGDCMLDAFLPFRTFESEEWFGVAFGDWRQLEKIARNDQLWGVCVRSEPRVRASCDMHLYTAKWQFGLLSYGLRDRREDVEQVPIHHRN